MVAVLLSFAVWPLPAIAAILYAGQTLILATARPYRTDLRVGSDASAAENTESSDSPS